MAEKRLTKNAREQLLLLLDAGAQSATTGKATSDLPGLNPMTIGALRKRKLADSVVITTKQRQYTVYWLTPLGLLAAKSEAPASGKKSKPAKVEAARAGDLIGPRLKTADKVTAAGFYRMASEIYHDDPCPTPAISTGIAETLVTKSPAHAWLKSPRCPLPAAARRSDATYGMDVGSAVHAFAFGDAKSDVVWIEAADWKESRTRNWRAAARQQGKTPILKVDRERVMRMAEILRPELERELGCALGDAYGEVVVAADEFGCWRRTRCDLLRGDLRVVLDVKTTELSAHPDAAAGRLFSQGAHLQEALTLHILDLLDPDNAGRRVMKFVSIEQDEPHATSVSQIDGASNEIAAQQLAYALTCWDAGVAKNEWPAYAKGVHRASMPNWMAQQWRLRAIELGLADEEGVSR